MSTLRKKGNTNVLLTESVVRPEAGDVGGGAAGAPGGCVPGGVKRAVPLDGAQHVARAGGRLAVAVDLQGEQGTGEQEMSRFIQRALPKHSFQPVCDFTRAHT